MALHAIIRNMDLGETLVLAPERYDPRRNALAEGLRSDTVPLSDLVTTSQETITTARGITEEKQYLILDTSNASEGIITYRKYPVAAHEIGSAKKVIYEGDVIISRLRPYLRQVAFVDEGLLKQWKNVTLVGSTEFFVLRSRERQEIAFLSAYLLTEPVQEVLNAAQEGGHHPRFNLDTLLKIRVPIDLVKNRECLSAKVKNAIALYRECERIMAELLTDSEKVLKH
jgi:hypothetical protein